ncbi:MAG: isoleucine--tRNA ligase [Nitrospirae bacterium]|nr:isoleucine--tRNA ligase [Nitrospirota bacterium]
MPKDYKNTLNLPQTDFPMKANLAQKEPAMLKFWEENRIYAQIQEKNKGSKDYILHDGPPYANGHIHIGHALNKILKDIIVKFKSMQGFYSPYVPGWDCHGLPIELQVDKNLGEKKEKIDALEKRRLCREYADKFVDIQREEFKRLGVFGDWTSPYLTMSYKYEGAIVREFLEFVRKGYVYKGKKPVHWCPSCITALAEAEVEYNDKESPSIFVKFRVKNPKGKLIPDPVKGAYFVIWTTTPWTLPANLALAVHPNFVYQLIKTPEGEVIVAQDLIENFIEKMGYKKNDFTITEGAWAGVELEGIICSHPWIDREIAVVLGEHVTLEQGTGVVHTAPGHGEDDYKTGLKYGLDIYAPVDDKGKFTKAVPEFEGQFVFKANFAIIEILKNKNALMQEEKVTHSYPHCWRCKKPVIFRATEQWFISVEHNALRKKCLEEIDKVNWVPKWGRDRIYNMVSNRPDWCISRQRTWGVPIMLIRCSDCDDFVRDESVLAAIIKSVAEKGADIWFIKTADEFLPQGYRCKKCNSASFSKEMDILDVWFDSGVSHTAVMENDSRLSWPADMYLEGSDQHRGWFQSSLLASVGTKGSSSYRTVLTHGFVVDGSGKKMSKSLGNVIAPQEVINANGAEILRLWVSAEDYRDDIRISKEILDRLTEAYRKIRNTARFLLGNLHNFDGRDHTGDLIEIDRWAMSRLQQLTLKITSAYENFDFHEVYHLLHNFCVVDMSSFYLDILKDRLYTFKTDSKERRAAQWVLHNILLTMTKLMAPIISFTAEEIWGFISGNKEESIFLSSFPRAAERFLNPELEEKWSGLITIRNEVNKALEIKRQSKFIGNSLAAKIILYLPENEFTLLKDYKEFLSTLFIVSNAEIRLASEKIDGAYESEEIKGIHIVVEKAEGNKCERCWNWSISVGSHADEPEVCERCYNVIK